MHRCKILLLVVVMIAANAGCGSKEVKKAKQFIDAGMYPQAIELLEVEIQDNPKNAEAHFLVGKCHLATDNDSRAQKAFERALLLDSGYRDEIGGAYTGLAVQALGPGRVTGVATPTNAANEAMGMIVKVPLGHGPCGIRTRVTFPSSRPRDPTRSSRPWAIPRGRAGPDPPRSRTSDSRTRAARGK